MATVTACLIVRDEEDNLPGTLASLEPWVDEICVVDTGSKDATPDIARRHGVRLGEFTWCDDFSAARNASIALATSDWILVVDADEQIDATSGPALRRAIADPQAQAYLVWIDNLVSTESGPDGPQVKSVGIPRLFRNRPEIRYTRAVHETIMDTLIALGAPEPQQSGLRLLHSGYLPEVVRARDKRGRNLAILETCHAQDATDLFNVFKLAGTYAGLGRLEEAVAVLEAAWPAIHGLDDRQRAAYPFLPLVAADLVSLSAELGKMSQAQGVAREALTWYPKVSELRYHAGEVSRRCGRFDEARAHLQAARSSAPWTEIYAGDPATRGHKAQLGLAQVAGLTGDLRGAHEACDAALALAPEDLEARCLKVRLTALSGQVQAAWQLLAGLLGSDASASPVLLLAAEMAWAQGEGETATGFWLGAKRSREGRARASAWLAISALARGELDGAAEALSGLRTVDLTEAAAAVVLAAVAGAPFTLDSAFEAERVLDEVHAWLQEMARDAEGRALAAFARGAAQQEARLPGIGALLTPS